MKNMAFKIAHIAVICLILMFGEYAPVSEKISMYAMIVAYIVAILKILYDCIAELKERNILNRQMVIIVAASGIFFVGYQSQAIIAMLSFLILEALYEFVLQKKTDYRERVKVILPKTATVFKNSNEMTVDADALVAGNIVVVKNGEKIPADGNVFVGKTTLDIGVLCGGQKSVEVQKEDRVYGGSVNLGKTIQVEITAPLAESMIFKMISRTEEAMDGTDDYVKKTTLLTRGLSMIIILGALVTALLPPMVWGYEYAPWTYKGMIILLMISFDRLPKLMNKSTISLIYNLFVKGILIRRSSMKTLAEVRGILLEKSKRFAEGAYRIDFIECEEVSKEELITFAAHIEYFSDHLIAKTIVDGFIQVARYEGVADINPVRINAVSDFEEIEGKGVTGKLAGKFICVGNRELMKLLNIKNLPSRDDRELVYVAIDQKYSGCIGLEYKQKAGVEDVYTAWSDAGIGKYAILDGNENEIVEELRDKLGEGKVAFVGVDNHHKEGDTTDMSIIMDGFENRLQAQGDMLVMDGTLSDIAETKNKIIATFKKGKLGTVVAVLLKIALYCVCAAVSAPVFIPLIIDGVSEIGYAIKLSTEK